MSGKTPWEFGRFDARAREKRILFGRMYEDAAIEESAFAPGGRVFCIASAGCTAIALASRYRVTAVDINIVQLEYAKRRAAGEARRIGSAERLMGVGRRAMALMGWRRSKLEAFCNLSDPPEQLQFWNRHLNTVAFRLLTDIGLSVRWLRFIYASPFLGVLPRRFGSVVRARMARCWGTHANRSNPYARALLLGDAAVTPPVARTSDIRFACAEAAAFLENCPADSFDGFTLSNILDGTPQEYRGRLIGAIQNAAAPGAVVILRSFAEPHAQTATNCAARDRSLLWGVVDVRPVSALQPVGWDF